jgi:hypothetical protein
MASKTYLSTGGKHRHPVLMMKKGVVMVWQVPQAIKAASLVRMIPRVVVGEMCIRERIVPVPRRS